jgi:hypothetical protein
MMAAIIHVKLPINRIKNLIELLKINKGLNLIIRKTPAVTIVAA